jgi:hypothetical protein
MSRSRLKVAGDNLFNQIYQTPRGVYPLPRPGQFPDSTPLASATAVNVVPREPGNLSARSIAESTGRPGDPSRSYLMYMLDKDPQARAFSAAVTAATSANSWPWINQGANNN